MQRGPARPQRDDRGPARPYEKRPATPWESGMDEDFDA